MEFNIELESTTSNTTLRMLELQNYMAAAAQGIPVDPIMIVDKMAESRADREQLRDYVEQAQQSQAQMKQMEMKQMEAAIGKQLQIEDSKAQETGRHNQATEQLESQQMMIDAATDFAKLIEKSDEAEKDVANTQFKAVQQRLAGMEQARLKAQRPPGRTNGSA
jgi:hypothetical protein